MLTDFGDGIGPMLRDMWADPFGRDLIYIGGAVVLLKTLAALIALLWFVREWRADKRERKETRRC